MTTLRAEDLAADPRVAEAKRLLLEALRDHQTGLTQVLPPLADRKVSYADALARLTAIRGNPLYHAYLGSGLGRGCLVELADGSVKYDFIAGIGVHFLGHNHPEIVASGIDAALQNTVMQGHLQQNRDQLELLELLLQGANRTKPDKRFVHAVLSSSGAMANENALKIALQKRHPAARVLAFQHGFAGRTLALSQITDKPAYREGLPALLNVDYVPFFDPMQPDASRCAAVDAMQGHLALHPGQHAAMFFELIQGEGGGYAVGEKEFFRALMEILKSAGVYIVADEIQTFGRTGELFAFQYFGLENFVDVITLGKMTQACATLFTAEMAPKPGLISQTYTASTSAIRAGLCVVKTLLQGDYLGPRGRILRVTDVFRAGLKHISERHPGWVAGPYGMGDMVAFTPFDGDADRAAKLCHTLFDLGLIGFVAGSQPTRLRFLPPVGAVEDSDIQNVLEILETGLDRCRPGA